MTTLAEPPDAAPRSGAALTLTNVSKRFPGVQALDDVSLTVTSGEIHGLIGENGAGKSTLVNILAGAVAPDSGAVEVRGERVESLDPLDLDAARHQRQLTRRSARVEPVGRREHPVRRAAHAARPVRRAEARVARVRGARGRRRPDRSAGDGRRPVARPPADGRDRARRPARDVGLVLDEPTAALPQHDAEALFEAVPRMRDRGIAVIYVSHRLEEVLSLCDRVTVLRDGRKVADRDAATPTGPSSCG